VYRKEVILKLGAIEREYRAVALAVQRLLQQADRDPNVLGSARITHFDVRACAAALESTYIVRLFAVFEDALRDVRRRAYRKRGPIQAEALLAQCASRQRVREGDVISAHRVREYRNVIVHGGDAAPVSLPQARKWLCTYFGWMPPQW